MNRLTRSASHRHADKTNEHTHGEVESLDEEVARVDVRILKRLRDVGAEAVRCYVDRERKLRQIVVVAQAVHHNLFLGLQNRERQILQAGGERRLQIRGGRQQSVSRKPLS